LSYQRKGNNSNNIIHVHKEKGNLRRLPRPSCAAKVEFSVLLKCENTFLPGKLLGRRSMEENHGERCKFCASRFNGHVLTRCLKKSKLNIYMIDNVCLKTHNVRCMKIPIDIFRTHNRNRSLSFINSDQLENVNKGSRHIKPVTLEKRLALMVMHPVNLGN